MDLRSLDSAFAGLAGSAASDEFSVIELAAPSSARIAVDPFGRRHILFQASNDSPIRPDTRSAGVQIAARELLVNGESRRFVDLACLDSSLNHVFTAVAVEALAAADGATSPDLAAALVLDRWRDLFRNPPKGGLTQSQRIGLFGELSLLEELSRTRVDAVRAWAGPSKGRHDFVSDDIDFEVKATLDRTGSSVTIHGIDQLTSYGTSRLYLVVFAVERVPIGGDSLLDLVARLHGLGVPPTELYKRLETSGASADDLEEDQGRLRIVSRRMVPVDGSFPRLTAESFSSWPVPGVAGIQYTVDLTAAPQPLDAAELSKVVSDFCGAVCQ